MALINHTEAMVQLARRAVMHSGDGPVPPEAKEALDRLCESCNGLVHKYALKRPIPEGRERCDRIQDSWLGLLRAIRCHDPGRGTKFTTTLGWSIESELKDDERTGTWPVCVPRYAYWRHRLAMQGRAEPSAHAAAIEAALTRPDAFEAEDGIVGAVSREPDPVDAAAHAELADKVRSILGCLTPRQRETVERRFGLAGRRPEVVSETAAALGISHQAVHHAINRALGRLREVLAAQAGP